MELKWIWILLQINLIDSTDDDVDALSYYIKDVIKHPNYSTLTKRNDIALVRMTNRVSFSPYVIPACINTQMRDEASDVKLSVTGWGLTSAESKSNEPLKSIQLNWINIISSIKKISTRTIKHSTENHSRNRASVTMQWYILEIQYKSKQCRLSQWHIRRAILRRWPNNKKCKRDTKW